MAGKPYQDESWLREKWESDLTKPEIAEEAGVTVHTIYKWAGKFDLPTTDKFKEPSGEKPYRDEDWLRDRWFTARSVPEIADEAGCSEYTLREWARKFDLPHKRDATPWRDEETLRRLYHDEQMSHYEIADELGCSATTVGENMRQFGIDTRSKSELYTLRTPHVQFHTVNGYEVVANQHAGTVHSALVHQLVAIANGADPHDLFGGGYAVHHENGIPWDNRPNNLETMAQEDHGRMHAQEQNQKPEGGA